MLYTIYSFVVGHEIFINIVIQVLVAIGTIGTVVISIYFSMNQYAVKVNMRLQIMRTFGELPFGLNKDKDYIIIFINNNCLRDIIFNQYSFGFVTRSRKDGIMCVTGDSGFLKYPRTILSFQPGQVVLSDYETSLKKFIEIGWNSRNIKSMKLFCKLSTGETIFIEISRQDRNRIIRDFNTLKEKNNIEPKQNNN